MQRRAYVHVCIVRVLYACTLYTCTAGDGGFEEVWAGYQESIVWAHKGQCGLGTRSQ